MDNYNEKPCKDDSTFQELFLKTTGRLNRLRYFKRIMAVMLITLAISLPPAIIFSDEFDNLTAFGEIVLSIINICALVPYYCLDVRRLHDMGKDDTLAKISVLIGIVVAVVEVPDEVDLMPVPLMIVYLVGTVIGFYLLFAPGTKGVNQYGSDPLE